MVQTTPTQPRSLGRGHCFRPQTTTTLTVSNTVVAGGEAGLLKQRWINDFHILSSSIYTSWPHPTSYQRQRLQTRFPFKAYKIKQREPCSRCNLRGNKKTRINILKLKCRMPLCPGETSLLYPKLHFDALWELFCCLYYEGDTQRPVLSSQVQVAWRKPTSSLQRSRLNNVVSQ